MGGNEKKVHVSVAIMLCDMEMHANSTPMNYSGQGHLMTLAKLRSLSCQLTLYSANTTSHFELLGQFQLNFVCSLQKKWKQKCV